jgi:hypothetical protein
MQAQMQAHARTRGAARRSAARSHLQLLTWRQLKNRIFLGHPQLALFLDKMPKADKKEKAPKKEKDKDAPKRALAAYMFFSKARRGGRFALHISGIVGVLSGVLAAAARRAPAWRRAARRRRTRSCLTRLAPRTRLAARRTCAPL